MTESEILKALEECELIDSIMPEALPLYINHQWTSEGVRKRYLDKLSDAMDLMERIDRLTKNPDNNPLLEIEL